MQRFYVVVILVILVCVNTSLNGQNLESISKEKPVSITGGLSLNQIVYSSNSMARAPRPVYVLCVREREFFALWLERACKF